ncbi:MAG TPA: type II toxin-antitoxin system RelE/ParE family toxin [Spirochaetota bacterium]|nr:type II toxin-antitoxin system RelE/ParE family toxin [Spirochaetota bacterium]HPM35456.1 type II toxin-antitoxin system RelE/ParE family toxin [Spirochaetota bacterium]HQO22054.1 type II toxin-antitoxin system RelE/ParE family toxin [Spirochaetota bacterium]HQQ22778.1 type II toxin-antitoxin system RelE/ParE family toxin [Spirochaetota bacterium]
MNFQVELTSEVSDFILSLPVKFQAKIQRTINLLCEFGYSLPEPHSKKIKSAHKIYELRIKLGSDICRLFYFHWKGTIYVVTSGYIKKTDKLDKREIEKAEKIKLLFED